MNQCSRCGYTVNLRLVLVEDLDVGDLVGPPTWICGGCEWYCTTIEGRRVLRLPGRLARAKE